MNTIKSIPSTIEELDRTTVDGFLEVNNLQDVADVIIKPGTTLRLCLEKFLLK